MTRRVAMVASAGFVVCALTLMSSGVATAAGRSAAPPAVGHVRPSTACSPWAVVNDDGSLARTGCAGARVKPDGLGGYGVIFTKSLRKCAYEATIGLSGSVGVSDPAFATVVGDPTNADGVLVTTYDAGAPRPPRVSTSQRVARPRHLPHVTPGRS